MDTIINSQGFKLKAHYVPHFTLNRGEYLSLNFCNTYDFEEEKQLREILTGFTRIHSVTLFDSIVSVSSDFKNTFWSNLLKPKDAFSALKQGTNSSDNDVNDTLQRLGIRKDESIYSLGHSEKISLQLEIAYSKSKNIIINSSGLDYTGIFKVRERLVKELNKGSVIELNYLTSKGREYLIDEGQLFQRKILDVK